MSIRMISVVFFCFAASTMVPAQNRDADSQTFREILSELRSIHEDMRVTETTQLLVAELEMQQSVLNRAVEKTDAARSKLSDIHSDQKRLAAEMKLAEEQMDKATNPEEKNAMAQDNERRKANIEAMKNVEREAASTLQDMEQRQQNAQDKLAASEAELNAAISRLGSNVKDGAQK